MLLHFQRVLLTCHDTQGAALGYEQVGPSGRSLSEKVYLYIIPEKNREIVSSVPKKKGEDHNLSPSGRSSLETNVPLNPSTPLYAL